MSALRVFDPAAPRVIARRSRRLPDFLRDDELTALFSAAYSAWQETPDRCARWKRARWRDWLMLQTAFYCGLRVLELTRLNVEDVDLDGALLFVRGSAHGGGGKGDNDGTVPISAKLLPALREWIGERKSGVLYPDPRGRHIHTRHVRDRLRLLAARAGIKRRCFPHILRHSFATHLLRKGLDNGVTIYDVQHLMRHRDISTTSIYLHLSPGKLKDAVELL